MTKLEETAEGAVASNRRGFMKVAGLGAAAGVAGKFSLAPISSASAQESDQEPWWPSKWGPEDQAGSTNHLTPEKVLESVQLVQDGRVYKLGRDYESGMPFFGTRSFTMVIPGAPTGGPFGSNKLIYNDEYLATEIGQVGTQFDGLGHIGLQLGEDGDKREMRYYNGFTELEVGNSLGLLKLGTEHLKPIVTRAHLIDAMAVHGQMMDVGEEITLEMLRSALEAQGMSEDDIRPGDGILFHTGWGQLWMENNDRYNSGCPGIGMEVAEWVVEKDLCFVGGDTWPVEVIPNPDPDLAFPVHGHLLAKHGIVIFENLHFDEVLADGKHRFLFMFTPLPIKGATGSPGCPIAIT